VPDPWVRDRIIRRALCGLCLVLGTCPALDAGFSYLQRVLMPTSPLPIHSDPDIMGGTAVFVGTRVTVQTLLDYLKAGDPLDEFLENFPSVSRDQAIAVREHAKEMLLARAAAV
jgi:uncharacterized protein (DUF433 family)